MLPVFLSKDDRQHKGDRKDEIAGWFNRINSKDKDIRDNRLLDK